MGQLCPFVSFWAVMLSKKQKSKVSIQYNKIPLVKKDDDSIRTYRKTHKKGVSQTYDTPSSFIYNPEISFSESPVYRIIFSIGSPSCSISRAISIERSILPSILPSSFPFFLPFSSAVSSEFLISR